MQYWEKFRRFVEKKVLGGRHYLVQDLTYWRDRLFCDFVLYSLPISLLAVVPSVVVAYRAGAVFMACFDLVIFGTALVVMLVLPLNLKWRKGLVVFILYFLASFLLGILGNFGPGALYLLVISVFITLISPVRLAYWSVALNALILCFLGYFIYQGQYPNYYLKHYKIGEWVSYSTNLIFLNLLCVGLINKVFTGLQATVRNENRLWEQLKAEGEQLGQTVAQLEFKNQEMEQFVYLVSHDLQEPLRTAAVLVGSLERELAEQLSEGSRQYLDFLHQINGRMNALVTGLLQYSRTGLAGEIVTVDCNLVVKAVLADLGAATSEKGAQVQVCPLPMLPAYELELKQLFQNLISNAVKYQLPGNTPRVIVNAESNNGEWTFSIADNGIGIAEKNREKIFGIFQRLHQRSEYSGTGIGLALCRKIVTRHGGNLWVEDNPGGGSIFRFTIPT